MCNAHATFTLPSACLRLGVSICQKPQRESSLGSKAWVNPQAGLMCLSGDVWVGRGQGRWGGRVGSLVWHLAMPRMQGPPFPWAQEGP